MEKERSPQINYLERNRDKVRVEGSQITIGEGQSSYQDIFNVYLLGPIDHSGNISTFEEIENDKGYKITSGGYLSCAEISGNFDVNKKFLIHSIDVQNFKKHISEILKLADGEIPENILIRLDPARGNIQEYQDQIRTLFDSKVEVNVEHF